jgi:hypothetical protein
MATLTEDDAWRMAMAAAAVLRGRVWVREARDESGAVAGFRGSMVTQYEWIDVQVFDPKSRAFAALPRVVVDHREGADVDYAAYGRATRRALELWKELARCEGFSARENPSFWLRVLQEVVPSISDVPRFFDTPGVAFPRFRLIFQPRDCYDNDLHDEHEAVDWIHTFCDGFFAPGNHRQETTSELHQSIHDLQSLISGQATQRPRTPFQVEFRVPMQRTHGPLGSALEQHGGFLRHAQQIATRLTTGGCGIADRVHVVKAVAVLRGSLRPREFVEIAPHFQSSSGLQLSGLCVDVTEDAASLDAFARVLETVAITCLTLNVAKATTASIDRVATLLQNNRQLRQLRLFNAFAGDRNDRCAQWELLGRALCHSTVEELVLERTRVDNEDVAAFRSAVAAETKASGLVSLAIKPLTTAGLSSQAYVDLVQTVGSKLHQLDVSALCLDAAGVDNVVRSCPHVKSLCLGTITGVEQSQLAATLSQRACPLRSLAVGCSEGDARYLLALLANQPPEIALAGTHLKELCLSIETMELATREALLHMLETNASLRYIHIKRRGLAETAPLVVDEQLLAHHQRQLVRKLPVRYALAFLSVLSHAAAVSKPSTSALERFDAGVASEIVGFAGHAVRRRFYCSP